MEEKISKKNFRNRFNRLKNKIVIGSTLAAYLGMAGIGNTQEFPIYPPDLFNEQEIEYVNDKEVSLKQGDFEVINGKIYLNNNIEVSEQEQFDGTYDQDGLEFICVDMDEESDSKERLFGPYKNRDIINDKLLENLSTPEEYDGSFDCIAVTEFSDENGKYYLTL